MSVMGFADKNIRKPEDIKGKTVAVTPGRFDVADLAAVPQENQPEGFGIQERAQATRKPS
jgi:ABC-type amino acid transport substrate-binding protein